MNEKFDKLPNFLGGFLLDKINFDIFLFYKRKIDLGERINHYIKIRIGRKDVVLWYLF
ncbi:hypothetical protein CLFO_10550 [Clostridium formicaceticum]|uniref:Uncharacterized protein n=1 Tax=Clostridium formicaceticum TaxID=1497 RepID=A0AAC9WFF5_9CLOT|nr:hypothetical protein CLFO_10550 [Clostridium formicaceticum]